MAMKIGPGRDLRSVMQKVEQARQAKNDFARTTGANEISERAVSGGQKSAQATPLSYDFEVGPPKGGEKIYIPAAANATKFGLAKASSNANRALDLSLDAAVAEPGITSRGGGWEFVAPEKVIEMSSMDPPFALSEELDPQGDPFAMVEAAARTVSNELKTQPGLATMVQANVSPARAYQLLSNN